MPSSLGVEKCIIGTLTSKSPITFFPQSNLHMFKTPRRILIHKGDGAKVTIWAHHSHPGDARATSMGSRRHELNIARQAFGNDVVGIGCGTNGGAVAAADEWNGERKI